MLYYLVWFLLLVITGSGSQESCRPVCHGVLRDDIFTSSQNRFTCMIATTESWFLTITESGNHYEANYLNLHLKKLKPHSKEAISYYCGWISGRFHFVSAAPYWMVSHCPGGIPGQARAERDHVTQPRETLRNLRVDHWLEDGQQLCSFLLNWWI